MFVGISVALFLGISAFLTVSAILGLSHWEEILSQNNVHETELKSLLIRQDTSLCVQQAVAELIGQCVDFGVDGIDPTTRRHLAARLAICEFLDANVDFPSSCRERAETVDYDPCIRDLEKQPQFWTSYSGYYRETHRLCHEQSLPYAKDQIVNLYYNITRIYGAIYENLQKSYGDSDTARKLVQERFEALSLLMQSLLLQSQREHETSRASAAEFTHEFKDMLTETTELFAGYSKDSAVQVDELLVLMRFMNSQFSDLSSAFQDQSYAEKLGEMKGAFMVEYQAATEISSEILASILVHLEAANLVSAETEEAAKKTSVVVQENHDMSASLKDGLQVLGNELLDQRRILRTEFEYSVVEFSVVVLELLAEYGDRVEQEMGGLSSIFREMDSQVHATLARVEELDVKLLVISASLNSSFLGVGLKMASLTYGITAKLREVSFWRPISAVFGMIQSALISVVVLVLVSVVVLAVLLLLAFKNRVFSASVVGALGFWAKYAALVVLAAIIGEFLVQVWIVA